MFIQNLILNNKIEAIFAVNELFAVTAIKISSRNNIKVIILGYIIAYLFYRYGKTVETKFWYIKWFFYFASVVNIFCSSFLIYNFYL